MEWNTAASIAEVLGAVGVIVSLIYLAAQVRSSTRAMKASAGFDVSLQMSELNESVFQALVGDTEYQQGKESRLAQLTLKIYDPEASPEEIAPSDLMVVTFVSRAVFQKIEGEYYLYQHGLLDPSHWEARRAWACGYIELPIPKLWWENEITQAIYRPDFIAAIDAEIKVRPKMPSAMHSGATEIS